MDDKQSAHVNVLLPTGGLAVWRGDKYFPCWRKYV